jgi:S-adenosylmethionine synthetase
VSNDYIFNSESVTAGHPDKVCDQVSDAIVDHFLMQDPHAHVVAESAVSSGVMFISTHFASQAVLDITEVARSVVRDIGYPQHVFDADACSVMTSYTDHTATEYQVLDFARLDDEYIDRLPSRQQLSVTGYACDQTVDLMPLPIWLAHRLAGRLDAEKVRKKLPYLLPDGKVQVAVEYKEGRASRIHGINLVVSQTDLEAADIARLHADLGKQVIEPVLKDVDCPLDADTLVSVNPEGQLIGGGPAAHSGLTGRKTGMDTYGEYSRHSGVALSGKGPFRIERVGAYAARHAAKNVVAAGLASECEVQLSYAVGSAAPVSVRVRCFGTGTIPDAEIVARLRAVFDFRLAALVRDLELTTLPAAHPEGFYRRLAVYGQMGRSDLDVPWERTGKAAALK